MAFGVRPDRLNRHLRDGTSPLCDIGVGCAQQSRDGCGGGKKAGLHGWEVQVQVSEVSRESRLLRRGGAASV